MGAFAVGSSGALWVQGFTCVIGGKWGANDSGLEIFAYSSTHSFLRGFFAYTCGRHGISLIWRKIYPGAEPEGATAGSKDGCQTYPFDNLFPRTLRLRLYFIVNLDSIYAILIDDN
jgi:hypothetical protein